MLPGQVRTVFMGSPDFALPALRGLVEGGYRVVGVYTQPDREAGRGRRLLPPPVKELAIRYGLPIHQPVNFRAGETVEELRALAPDVIVVAAYGLILPRTVLAVPRRGILNVHASLLPRWRGAAPVAAAILAGDPETGVSIMEIVPALDAGPVVAQRATPIHDDYTAGTLTQRLAEEGAALLLATLPAWYDGRLEARPQNEAEVTYAPPVKKDDAAIDWTVPAVQIWRQIRAYNPWPVAFSSLPSGEPLRILEAQPLAVTPEAAPGTVVPAPPDLPRESFAIATGDGLLLPLLVQRAGGKPVSAAEFSRGRRGLMGARLGSGAEIQ